MQCRRLKYFGHRVRAAPNSPTAQGLAQTHDTSVIERPCGHPPLCWIDIVKKDLATLSPTLQVATKVEQTDRRHDPVIDICSM